MKFFTSIILTSSLFFAMGCSNSQKVETKTEDKVENQSEMDKVKHPSQTAVDFYASGEDDSWKLSVRFGGEIVFTDIKNNIQFRSESNEKTVAQGANVVQIFSKNKTHVINVSIDIVECMRTGKKINIMVRKTNEKKGLDYAGCGYYRGAPQLHDIWALHKMNGEELKARQFPKELPHFEFNLETQKMSGFAGCNQVYGNLSFEYKKMIIDQLSSTRMYCGDASDIENNILTILRDQPVYHLKGLILVLETTKGSITLKKVD